jgi:Uma2 family endonuclease
VIIELLSTSTEKTDKNLKKALYQDRFRAPEYFLFSPEALTLTGRGLRPNTLAVCQHSTCEFV